MCSRDKGIQVFFKVPIILVICIIGFSLAFHFLAEELDLHIQQQIQNIEKHIGKQLSQFHEHSEDLFILISLASISPLFVFSPIIQPIFPGWLSLAIKPNFPPPNR